eukprot:CAMPEP_0184478866 /NCGR_PEP_ID=MMETSP0113_2-20130426/769_1 /TAXON_ID=91329 /ORGANISM="Norrisiella sphaerica, Strain BC52" /LENGTH=156 /DNA_ID=CAMNT_0026856789 /DNA_START=118 /DNA_END=588 /DNA_ORIENTATION=-
MPCPEKDCGIILSPVELLYILDPDQLEAYRGLATVLFLRSHDEEEKAKEVAENEVPLVPGIYREILTKYEALHLHQHGAENDDEDDEATLIDEQIVSVASPSLSESRFPEIEIPHDESDSIVAKERPAIEPAAMGEANAVDAEDANAEDAKKQKRQ